MLAGEGAAPRAAARAAGGRARARRARARPQALGLRAARPRRRGPRRGGAARRGARGAGAARRPRRRQRAHVAAGRRARGRARGGRRLRARCAWALSAATWPSRCPATPTTPSSCRSPSRPTSRASTACGRAPWRCRRACSPRSRTCATRSAARTRCGGRPRRGPRRAPGRPASMEEHEDAVLAALDAAVGPSRPHDDPTPPAVWRGASCSAWTAWASGAATTPSSPTWRAASPATTALWPRRWARLCSRRALAEKPSVGQRHVFLNPKRAGDIHALIERGEAPAGVKLP